MTRKGSRGGWRAPTPGRVWRHLRESQTPTWQKAIVAAAFAYVVFPFDAVPDLTPIIGWLDDLGVGTASLVFLSWALGRQPPSPNQTLPREKSTAHGQGTTTQQDQERR